MDQEVCRYGALPWAISQEGVETLTAPVVVLLVLAALVLTAPSVFFRLVVASAVVYVLVVCALVALVLTHLIAGLASTPQGAAAVILAVGAMASLRTAGGERRSTVSGILLLLAALHVVMIPAPEPAKLDPLVL
ncbi:MAG: hypothetical protein CMC99_03090 [Flavobacteriales bacterium]|nr:hypothetical protein [Flavobacteriales bacterium]|tara:strand:+ start:2370 stop:2771 length:402 start_codon:yes stop_codon:yes gene_type:complete